MSTASCIGFHTSQPRSFRCICHINARSLYAFDKDLKSNRTKLDEIESVLCFQYRYDIICISETWFKSNISCEDIKTTIPFIAKIGQIIPVTEEQLFMQRITYYHNVVSRSKFKAQNIFVQNLFQSVSAIDLPAVYLMSEQLSLNILKTQLKT